MDSAEPQIGVTGVGPAEMASSVWLCWLISSQADHPADWTALASRQLDAYRSWRLLC